MNDQHTKSTGQVSRSTDNGANHELSEESRAVSKTRFPNRRPVVLGSLQQGQSWDDFKAKLKAALIRQGVINPDGSAVNRAEE